MISTNHLHRNTTNVRNINNDDDDDDDDDDDKKNDNVGRGGKPSKPMMIVAAQTEDWYLLRKQIVHEKADVNVQDVDGETALSTACRKGNIGFAQVLLNHGAKINVGRTSTPISRACDSGNRDLVRLLLQSGCSSSNSNSTACARCGVDEINEASGETALSLACMKGDIHTAKLLLDYGAKDSLGRTPPIEGAYKSRNRELIKLLLERCENVNNMKDANGQPFIFSVGADILRLFFDHGADLNITDGGGRNLLFYAGSADSVELLLNRGLQWNATDRRHKQCPLHRITSADAARALIDRGAKIDVKDTYGKTPLHYALGMRCESRYHVIKELLKRGADVNARDSGGETPLHSACSIKYTFAFDVVSVLLDHGAEINALDGRGRTPLEVAYLNRAERSLIDFLLRRSYVLLIESDDDSNESLLHMECKRRDVCKDLVQLLLDRGGVDIINDADDYGQTPLHLLIINLIDQICSGHASDEFHDNALESIKLLVARGADVNAKNVYGQTPLSLTYGKVIQCSDYEDIHNMGDLATQLKVAKFLMSTGADVNVPNDQGETLLHVFCGGRGYASLVNATAAIERGAVLDAKNAEGLTALHLACQHGQVDIVRFLLGQGAVTDIHDCNGSTAMHLASLQKHWVIVRLLLEHGTEQVDAKSYGELAMDDDSP